LSVLRRPLHSGSSKLKLIVIIGIIALLGAGVVYVLYGQPTPEDGDEPPEDGEESSEDGEHPASPPVVYAIGNFLVNVRTNDELRYLRVEVAAGIRDYEAEESGGGHGDSSNEELPSLRSEDEAVARDLIVKILSDSSFASLRTATGREQAKERIKQGLGEMLEDAQVENVLFLSFVMQ